MLFDVPQLTVRWDGSFEDAVVEEQAFSPLPGLRIGGSGFRPQPYVRETGRGAITIVGSPIYDGRIDPCHLSQCLADAEDIKRVIATINGQFLVLFMDKRSRRLQVFNDRFNGVPFYYTFVDGIFYGSLLYLDLVKQIRKLPAFKFSHATFFEFIYLQRLLGTKTHDSLSEFLPPASVLTVGENQCQHQRYWLPSFQKVERSKREAGEEFAFLLRQSISRRLADARERRPGLFLSGGHDSRTILAAFPTPPSCLTVSFSDNYEVKCARQSAAAAGAEHIFIPLEKDHLIKHQDQMSYICGGLFSSDNALFVGMEEQVAEKSDLLFHGHGFDYLFQGMYLPTKTITLLGRPTFFRRLVEIPESLTDFYLENIPFRITDLDLYDFVHPDAKESLRSYMRSAVEEVLLEGRTLTGDPFDQWEYMVVHALGRHYSHPNIVSKMCAAEQRTIAFDNDLFDFYLSLTPQMRINAYVMRYAMKKFNPRLASIPTGNYGIAAGASPLYKTSYLIGRKLLRHLTGIQGLQAPQPEDRTWPDRDNYIRSNPEYLQFAKNAIASEELRGLMPYLDWQKIEVQVDAWMQQKRGGGKFLLSLISLGKFLEFIK